MATARAKNNEQSRDHKGVAALLHRSEQLCERDVGQRFPSGAGRCAVDGNVRLALDVQFEMPSLPGGLHQQRTVA